LKIPKLAEIIEKEGIEKKFKLASSISTNNYVLFDHSGKIKRYGGEDEIMQEFFVLRKELYTRRKDYLLAKLRKERETINSKVRFIMGVIEETIKVNRVKKRDLVKTLR
jgi:DNA topoisomerase-2